MHNRPLSWWKQHIQLLIGNSTPHLGLAHNWFLSQVFHRICFVVLKRYWYIDRLVSCTWVSNMASALSVRKIRSVQSCEVPSNSYQLCPYGQVLLIFLRQGCSHTCVCIPYPWQELAIAFTTGSGSRQLSYFNKSHTCVLIVLSLCTHNHAKTIHLVFHAWYISLMLLAELSGVVTSENEFCMWLTKDMYACSVLMFCFMCNILVCLTGTFKSTIWNV